jgi:FkbH-like protein
MERFQSQDTLFAPRPSRLSLLKLRRNLSRPKKTTCNVWRNHAFEAIENLIPPYAGFGNWEIEFVQSDYDDSLSFSQYVTADIDLIWLDSSRYFPRTSIDQWKEWIVTRIRALRALTHGPILLATWLEGIETSQALLKCLSEFPGVHFCDLGLLASNHSMSLLDPRVATVSGSPISPKTHAFIARELACKWLPASVLPPIKAIVLDLDNTLYQGVLGEDGPTGIHLTPQHALLQTRMKELQGKGIFLALASRNELQDVESLFATRTDFPLRWEDFSATQISWGSKAQSIVTIANTLRIGTDAVLFVDDNPGELNDVGNRLPSTSLVFAGGDPETTARAVSFFPGLWRWNVGADDVLRIRDLKANSKREEILSQAQDPLEYFRELGVTLTYRLDPKDLVERVAALSLKTNQFNLALRRFSPADIANYLEDADANIVTVQLTDRLSDSGVIAAIIGVRKGSQFVVEEVCISCRALGRNLEDTIILQAVSMMPIFAEAESVAFQATVGERNRPALEWLETHALMPSPPLPGLYSIPAIIIRQFISMDGLTVIKE